jgi:hypothetical protein
LVAIRVSFALCLDHGPANTIDAAYADQPGNRGLRVAYLTDYDLDSDGTNDLVITAPAAYDADRFAFYLKGTGSGNYVDNGATWGLPARVIPRASPITAAMASSISPYPQPRPALASGSIKLTALSPIRQPPRR